MQARSLKVILDLEDFVYCQVYVILRQGGLDLRGGQDGKVDYFIRKRHDYRTIVWWRSGPREIIFIGQCKSSSMNFI